MARSNRGAPLPYRHAADPRTQKSAPVALGPQRNLKRVLELDQRDEVRPPLSVEQPKHRRVLQVRIPRSLTDRPLTELALQRPRDLLRHLRCPLRLTVRPLPGDQLVPRSSDDTTAARHLRPTLWHREAHTTKDLTWCFIRTTLTEHLFDFLVEWVLKGGQR